MSDNLISQPEIKIVKAGIEVAHRDGMTIVLRPDSSNIKGLLFDHAADTIVVEFNNGGRYSYRPASWETFKAIAEAPSAGKAFDFHIRKAPQGTYEVTKIDVVAPDVAPDLITDDDEEDSMPPEQPRLDGEPERHGYH